MALMEGRTGVQTTTDGTVNPLRQSKDGSLIIQPYGGSYMELGLRAKLFQASNQGPGGTTTTVGLATTHTGLVVSNPAGSTVNLVMLKYSLSVVGAPVALSSIGLLGGYASAGLVTHTTPLTPLTTFMNTQSTTGVAKADAAATLPSTPTLLQCFGQTPITGATAQVVNPPVNLWDVDLQGLYVLPPGAYIGTYTSTVITVISSFVWAEIPV